MRLPSALVLSITGSELELAHLRSSSLDLPQASHRIFHKRRVEHSINRLVLERDHRQVPVVVPTRDELLRLVETNIHNFVIQLETEMTGHGKAAVAWGKSILPSRLLWGTIP